MSFSDVSSAANFFSQANEGFTTTTSGSTASGATSVGLNSVAGLTNGSVFVGVIEPGETKEQVFTGIVDTSGSQITSVVWTKGTNVTHSTGVSVVDYDTGTHHNLTSKGLLVEHNKTGNHTNITGTSVNVTGAVSADTISEHTAAAGVTADGVLLKDSRIQTADAVSDSALIYGKVRSRQGNSATNWATTGTTTYDYSATDTFIQVGSKAITADPTTITFPTAFNQVPIVLLTVASASGANAEAHLTADPTTTTCSVRTTRTTDGASVTSETVFWMAIGQ